MCNTPIQSAEGSASVLLFCTKSGWAWRSCQNMSAASSHRLEIRKSPFIQTNGCNKGQGSWINTCPDKLNQRLPRYLLLLSPSHRAVRHTRSACHRGGTQQLLKMCHTLKLVCVEKMLEWGAAIGDRYKQTLPVKAKTSDFSELGLQRPLVPSHEGH